MKNKMIIKELNAIIEVLERKRNKSDLLERIIDDLLVDSRNLEVYFKKTKRNKK